MNRSHSFYGLVNGLWVLTEASSPPPSRHKNSTDSSSNTLEWNRRKATIPFSGINKCGAGSRSYSIVSTKWPALIHAHTQTHINTEHEFINKSRWTVKMSALYHHQICTLPFSDSAGWIRSRTVPTAICAGRTHEGLRSLNIYVQKHTTDKRLWWYIKRARRKHRAGICTIRQTAQWHSHNAVYALRYYAI